MSFGRWVSMGSIWVSDSETLVGLTDISVTFDGTRFDLVATSRGGGWVHCFTGNDQAGDTVAVSALALPSHLLQLESPDLALVEMGGQVTAVLGGVKSNSLQILDLEGTMALSGQVIGGLSAKEIGTLVEMGSDAGFVAATLSGEVVQVDLTTNQRTVLAVEGHLIGATATALAYLDTGTQQYSVAAYGQDNTLALFASASGSMLQMTDMIQAGTEGLWIGTPTAVSMVEVGGQVFVVAAAAGSSSISVLAVDPVTSQVTVVDHVMDTLNTRFSDVTHLETVQKGDRTYVVAAGSDGGLTLLSLLPDGSLVHLESLEATADVPLQSITGLTTAVTGDWLRVWITTQEAPYLVEFAVDLSQQGTTQQASGGGTLAGTGQADILLGGDESDTLQGGGGNDILRDGAGQDTLSGGGSSDIFVFQSDGQRDRIIDFDPTQDKIDLGQLDSQFDLHTIKMTSRSWGVEIQIGDETFEIYGATADVLTRDDVAAALLVPDLGRVAPVLEPDPNAGAFLPGSPGDDILIGTEVQDTLQGYAGDDLISGREDADYLDGGEGADILVGGLGDDQAFGGQGNDVLHGDIPDDLTWI